ncbi:MAG: hypothetical protein KAS70_04610, partial [Planctomycetes bacterium]|nr:hypothetical protein [Planctomycetota bacterium]
MNNSPTRLGLFCDRLIEAGWLAAIIIAPFFLNFHSISVIEIDKSSLIRSLALFMLIAYCIRLLETPKDTGQAKDPTLRNPLITLALLMGVVYIFSWLVSITRYISWWGDDARGQGT